MELRRLELMCSRSATGEGRGGLLEPTALNPQLNRHFLSFVSIDQWDNQL